MLDGTIYEYLAIISPEEKVRADIQEMKQSCKRDYGWKLEAGTKPHLTLFSYRGNAESERILIKNFEQITTQTPSINIRLSNFNFFAGQNYTIYARVEEDPDLSRLLRNLKNVLSNWLRSGKNPTYSPSTKAHLTIAKSISRYDFEKVWPAWKNKNYQASFKADRMLLLRRTPGFMYGKFDRIAELIFQGKPMNSAQTMLF
ncbi:2'-5' RNA ligase family protein [Pedobacter sp. SAFR-022]|uniref:2'-5' RNA ligase family protein n=1 Tax=Pedobacter sp. SAFR-022 TaxID=3436861 RepID=UPI003F822271